MRKIKENSGISSFFKRPECFIDKYIDLKGMVYRVKDLGSFCFLHLSTLSGIIQCVLESNFSELKEGQTVHIKGVVKKANIKDKFIAYRDVEIHVENVEIVSCAIDAYPFDITKKKLNINNDTKFDLRAISMRHPKEKAIFKIQEGIVHGLRNYFISQGCTEIRTPKLVKAGAEGGANIFEIDYFGQTAYLAQSPQFYKEFCVGVFDRVFEIAPVFRAEKHNTSRHLNEYTSVDVELGNISSFYEIMEFEVGALKSALMNLETNYRYELDLLEITLPTLGDVPSIKFSEVKRIMKEEFNIKEIENNDLSPIEEIKICEYSKKETGSDFIFVTHYPSSKRPFYTKDDPENLNETLSFDLLFNGVEITTGGQRIHDYTELIDKMKLRGINLEDFEFYSNIHKYGIPSHGGLGMGLERLTQKIVGLDNIKQAVMFPRDISRLTP